MPIKIRPAISADAPLILQFITDLAIFEKAEEEVLANVSDIKKSLFSDNSTTFGLICENEGQAIGFAIYFFNYSTWLGKRGLYLEDLYITPQQRGSGAGKKVLKYLANIAYKNDCGRFEWSVLDWNEPAINFYQSIGAKPQDEWIGYRMDAKRIKSFALDIDEPI